MKEQEKRKCTKIEFVNSFSSDGSPNNTRILKGIILEDHEDRIKFKTAHREYIIFKKFMISMSDTKEDFVDGDSYD